MLYLTPFFLSFFLSLFATAVIIWGSRKFRQYKIKGKFLKKMRTSSRHIHNKKISRFGGIAIIFSFLITLIIDPHLVISPELWGVMVASLLILVIGLWDDLRELHWRTQLFFQISVAVFMFIVGVRVEYVTNPLGGVFFLSALMPNFIQGELSVLLPGLLVVVLWVVLFMNAMNWADGVDGLSGGITFLGAITIFVLSLKPEVYQPPVAIISLSLAGAVLGFLLLNFYPSKILAGSSGSLFMGFTLSILAIFAGTKIATTLMVMTIPVMDALWVIGERVRSGSSVFKSDKRHLHYKLLRIGWKPRQICLFFYTITLVICTIALNTRSIGKLVTISLAGLVLVVVLLFLRRKLSEAKLAEV